MYGMLMHEKVMKAGGSKGKVIKIRSKHIIMKKK